MVRNTNKLKNKTKTTLEFHSFQSNDVGCHLPQMLAKILKVETVVMIGGLKHMSNHQILSAA